MKLRAAVTTILLTFVAASVGYLIVKEIGRKPGKETTPSLESRVAAEQKERPSASSETKAETSTILVYYFHGNARCMTCRTIEAYAKEAVESGFSEAMKNGRLEWRVVNVEESGRGHYIQDFQLTTRSVVLERISDGERRDWKNLHRVWELVRDKGAFLNYIQDETRVFMNTAGK